MAENIVRFILFEACCGRAFQMAVDDDVLHKNPFGFELATVIVNDSVMSEAISREQMRKFLKFVYDDNVYCKYYEVVYILFHTGMRISEFCGLTLKDIDLENRIINIDHQLLRTSEGKYVIEATKTNARTGKLSMTEDVFRCFQAIIEDREKPRYEKILDGYTGFLFTDRMENRWWRCIGNTASTTWSSDTMVFTGCRCRTSRPTSAAIPTTATWRSRA